MNIKIGEIFRRSWGYDQTNVDYFQVVELKAKTVVVREIDSTLVEGSAGAMCGNVVPVKDKFLSNSRAYSENWERSIPECVGIYLFNDTRMAWRGNGKDYSYYDLYFLFQEIPARPNGTEQVTTADCKGQGVLTYAD
jgi:hypothetical protein